MPRCPARRWCRVARGFIQQALIFPGLRLGYSAQTFGAENIRGLEGPLIIAANHHLQLDNAVILKAMPRQLRRRLAIAASAHMFQNRVRSVLIPLLGNGFPFAKEGWPVRSSLKNAGKILGKGWSVLMYPEGELTIGGPLKPFKAGVGLMATESGLPVIPVRLNVKRLGFPAFAPIIRRGRVEIYIGRPMVFDQSVSKREATLQIEQAIGSLN